MSTETLHHRDHPSPTSMAERAPPSGLNKTSVHITLPVTDIQRDDAVADSSDKQGPNKKHRLIRSADGGYSAYRGIQIASHPELKGAYGCWEAELLDEHGTPVKAMTLKGLREGIDRVLDAPTDRST